MENIVLVLVILIVAVLLYKKMKAKKPACRKQVKRVPEPAPRAAQNEYAREYDYQDVLNENGLLPEQFSSHNQFVQDTFSESLLLGSSKNIIRDDVNDINPVLGLRRVNYNVHIGEGARQVPSEDISQLPVVQPPRFV